MHFITGLAVLLALILPSPFARCVCVGTILRSGQASCSHLYVCFGFVEQAQGGVAVAVRSQRYEGLQPLQTQPQVSSSKWGTETDRMLVDVHQRNESEMFRTGSYRTGKPFRDMCGN